MIPRHPAIPGPIFELMKIVEIDCAFGGQMVPVRIELYRDTENASRFRCRLWEREAFRLTPTFPQNEAGQPTEISDDEILAERSGQLSKEFDDFMAPDPETALTVVLNSLLERLEQGTGE
ncbi:MAG: hypothetical protein ACE5KF_02760 [Kiloniellaceae bacterium]